MPLGSSCFRSESAESARLIPGDHTAVTSVSAIDRSGPRVTRRAALAGMVIAWVVLAIFKGHLAGMTVRLIVLDISVTLVDISNRTVLYGLDPKIRTRLNAVYQVAMFSGGASCRSLSASAGHWAAGSLCARSAWSLW